MSEQKLDQIIDKLDIMDGRLSHHEEMISTLIKMIANVSAKTEEMADDLKETNSTLHLFRSETDMHFRKLNRRVNLIESDLDETMVQVSEITIPRNLKVK